MAEWKRETTERQAKLAKDFTALVEGVDRLEIFILDPSSGWDDEKKRAQEASSRLMRWKIKERVSVTDVREIARLFSGIRRSIETGGPIAACFEPRHGVRFTKAGQVVEMALCFECAGMEVQGSPGFDGAPISPAAEVDFYRVFRAHGLVRPAKLKGKSDGEIAKLLVGEWTNKGKSNEHGIVQIWKSHRVFAADGSYVCEGETVIKFKSSDSDQPFADREEGKWRIEDGILLTMAKEGSENFPEMTVIEYASPVLEAGPNRIVLGSTSLKRSDWKSMLRRK